MGALRQAPAQAQVQSRPAARVGAPVFMVESATSMVKMVPKMHRSARSTTEMPVVVADLVVADLALRQALAQAQDPMVVARALPLAFITTRVYSMTRMARVAPSIQSTAKMSEAQFAQARRPWRLQVTRPRLLRLSLLRAISVEPACALVTSTGTTKSGRAILPMRWANSLTAKISDK